MSFNDLHKTTGLIFENENYIGTCILFPRNNELYAITAGHNFFGKNFDKLPAIRNLSVSDYSNTKHMIAEVLCDAEFAKAQDIVIAKLDCKTSLADFVCPKFCTIPKNPQHSLLFRGKYNYSDEIVMHRRITFNSVSKNQNKFLCDIDRTLLMNDEYKSGSDWLGGWSGSGLFLDNHSELVCAGVMCEIPNKGNDGQLLFSSISILETQGFDLGIFGAEVLDFDPILNAKSVNAIFAAIDENAIMDWEKTNADSPQLLHLNRKLKEIYPEQKLADNKKRIITQLLLGKSYLATELVKNEQLKALYEKAKHVYDLEDKQFYVDNKKEAKACLTKIKEEYEQYLITNISQFIPTADVKVLAFYGVSEWISDCSLDFLPNE